MQPRRHPDRDHVIYLELRRQLDNLGCKFRSQADGSHEMWINPATADRPSSPGTGIVVWLQQPFTKYQKAWESPEWNSTKHKPPRLVHSLPEQ